MKKIILYILICLWCVNANSTPLSSLSDTIQICDSVFNDSITFTENEQQPSWKRLGMHTGMFVGCGVVTLVTLELLPENATAWNKSEIKNIPLFTRYANHFKKGPVIDHDRLTFNYILHPYAGAVYYNAARGAGFNRWQSFLFSTFVSNVLWEYGIECFNEIPSIQDLFITPVVGSLVGEGFYVAKQKIIHRNYNVLGSRFVGKFLCWILDPFNEFASLFIKDNRNVNSAMIIGNKSCLFSLSIRI